MGCLPMANGIVRPLDDQRRVSIPAEIQRQLDWSSGDLIEVTVKGDVVSLRKYAPGCVFCGIAEGDQTELNGKLICEDCCKRVSR